MNLIYITSRASIPKWRWHLQVGVSLGLNEMTHVQCLTPKMAFWAQRVLVPRKPFACSIWAPWVFPQSRHRTQHTVNTQHLLSWKSGPRAQKTCEWWPHSNSSDWKTGTKRPGRFTLSPVTYLANIYWVFTPFARRLARPGDTAGTCHYTCSDANRRTRWPSRQTWVDTITQQFTDSMILGTLFNPHQFEFHKFYNRVYNNSTFTTQGC